MDKHARLTVLAAVSVAIALAGADCSRLAPTGTLRVTYYYLPG